MIKQKTIEMNKFEYCEVSVFTFFLTSSGVTTKIDKNVSTLMVLEEINFKTSRLNPISETFDVLN